MSSLVQPQAAAQPNLYKTLFATCVGNALEWFDIAVYGFFASYIAHAFFPTEDPSVSMLLTFGSFGVSFLIRPLGAIVLGAYADRVGRKKALLMSIMLMMVGGLIITVMPSYQSIGLLAPLMILLARLIQGFSAGGEFGSSTAFLVEHFPERRAFIASWQFATQGASTLMASAFGLGLTSWLTETQIQDWGWRIPFAFGLIIGPVGLYIRRHVHEPASFVAQEKSHAPLKDLMSRQKTLLLLAMGLMVISTGVNYMLNYVPTYATKTLHLPGSAAFTATLVAGIILTVVTPLMGLWAEKVGRVPLMWGSLILLALTIYPAFRMVVNNTTPTTLILLVGWMALLKSVYFSTVPSMMADLFPITTRASGMAISYNVAVTVFGGFAPLICTLLISATGSSLAPSYYLILLALFSAVALVNSQRRVGR
ncbi:membrane protein [bacteria symbiont BFo1 of Frankliniella occidentalis]|uniref:MFS transporter n=1 Tax=Erwinia aphidicola TaxID=68334 RepID=A0ABU8DGC4_ERWAP|nr:MFS transporter [Erwinia sp. V90_4]KMV70683.1 membrane protein [bacteria symbiont BFo1 of Frankliniella occidentalis]PIJ55126.1 MFS transporter [Erwinia sp. OLMDLW33]KYP84895.1 membrane protein [bacteria symbiont BFo1 of Frankliniella occidentalis]KYP90222.1 membrane protein [bacteria symbiont BFo1 of Frankliniella occidentalis]MDI3440921.1 MFS transporter [Erwinia sp. V90_4]